MRRWMPIAREDADLPASFDDGARDDDAECSHADDQAEPHSPHRKRGRSPPQRPPESRARRTAARGTRGRCAGRFGLSPLDPVALVPAASYTWLVGLVAPTVFRSVALRTEPGRRGFLDADRAESPRGAASGSFTAGRRRELLLG